MFTAILHYLLVEIVCSPAIPADVLFPLWSSGLQSNMNFGFKVFIMWGSQGSSRLCSEKVKNNIMGYLKTACVLCLLREVLAVFAFFSFLFWDWNLSSQGEYFSFWWLCFILPNHTGTTSHSGCLAKRLRTKFIQNHSRNWGMHTHTCSLYFVFI